MKVDANEIEAIATILAPKVADLLEHRLTELPKPGQSIPEASVLAQIAELVEPQPAPTDTVAEPGTPRAVDDYEDYWDRISESDLQYLTAPRHWPACLGIEPEPDWPDPWWHPGPCFICGGRRVHSRECKELKASWEAKITFGKHKGKRVSEVPLDYLRWVQDNTDVCDADVKKAIEERLAVLR